MNLNKFYYIKCFSPVMLLFLLQSYPMKLQGTINNGNFKKTMDFIVKNTSSTEDITLLFTNDCTIFYSEAIYGQLQITQSFVLESRHEYKSNPCIGVHLKQSTLQKVASKMKSFSSFEFILVKGPKLKFYTHQFSFSCIVDLVHPDQYRNEVNVPVALKFKLPDLRQYADVLSNLGDSVTISVGDYLKIEQRGIGSQICIKLPIEVVELFGVVGQVVHVTVHSKALAKLFKSQVENSIGCINDEFFGIYIQLPSDGWMILCLDTLVDTS
eukprot:NODE_198_length_15297_cov_0.486182.p8 type:complete len:269 gc:universal NODE_198_length_15297_cov_0.486182:9888-10694(+)